MKTTKDKAGMNKTKGGFKQKYLKRETKRRDGKTNLNAAKRLDAIKRERIKENESTDDDDLVGGERVVDDVLPVRTGEKNVGLNAGLTGQVLTPTQQAIENWKARQQNVPWFWLSFTINKVFKGIVIVQGWNFLDAVNTANKMKVSIPMAQIYGEELDDGFVARVNQVNRLLTRKQAEKVFKGVKEVDEVELFKPEVVDGGKIDFTGFDGVKEFNPNI